VRDESILDDPARLADADQGGMLRALAGAGAQVRRTALAAGEAGVPALREDGIPRSVVVLGTGIAALAADAVAALAGPAATAPIVVHRAAYLPRWVGAADVVVGLSPTGAGVEALSATDAAARRGARVVGVGVDESPLAAVVAGARGPYVAIEDPHWRRTAFWPLLTGLACLVDAVGVIDIGAEAFDQTAARLDEEAMRCRPDSDSVVNPAKQLAQQLLDAVPVAWASSVLTAVAAQRFSESLAGMAGVVGSHGLLDGEPQALGLFGGPLAGVRTVEDLFADRLDEPDVRRAHPVLLRDSAPSPALDRAAALAEYYQVAVTEFMIDEAAPIVGLAQVVAQLDFAAGYLAMADGLDPSREAVSDGSLPE
jgi:hypothetical protein